MNCTICGWEQLETTLCRSCGFDYAKDELLYPFPLREQERRDLESAMAQFCVKESPLSDFEIVNGVLRQYIGSEHDVRIPRAVMSIGKDAFNRCKSLQSITIPNSVTSIGEYAFWGCSALQSITIPNSVTSIGFSAFSDCTSLQTVSIPSSVTEIGKSAFLGCSSLQSITIPDSVTFIGEGAFERCDSLRSLTISFGVRTIEKDAFPSHTIDDLMRTLRNSDKLRIPEEKDDSAETILAEFDKLEGKEIQAAKSKVLSVINYFCSMRLEFEERKKAGQRVSDDDFPPMNMLIYGAPGTGKTTIANLAGRLMFAKGILPSSKVHTVQAGDLGSGHVHGVQERLMEEADKAVGGVLLIDELQEIVGAWDGEDLVEAFASALSAVIEKYRDNMCVILCGYEDEVNRIMNGDGYLRHLIGVRIKLENYSLDTLMVILGKLLESDGKTLGEGVEEKLRKLIRSDMKTQGKSFGNVGYLKASILDPIKAAYFERGQNDKIYLMDDLLRAFKHSDRLRILEEKDAFPSHNKEILV